MELAIVVCLINMKLSIKLHKDEETGDQYKAIYIDDVLFDWGMEKEHLNDAIKMTKNDPIMKKSLNEDIKRHFIESLSEFIGKEITLEETNEAIKSGHMQ